MILFISVWFLCGATAAGAYRASFRALDLPWGKEQLGICSLIVLFGLCSFIAMFGEIHYWGVDFDWRV